MGDGCSPKNLAALLTAKNQANGRDIFSEAHRVNQMDGGQLAHYEMMMAQQFGIDFRKQGRSGWDILSKKGLAEKPSMVDDRLYAYPSVGFSEKFYGALDRRLTAWSKGRDTSMESYRKNIAKPVQEVLDAINKVVEETKSIPQMNAKLKPFGLTAENVYDARDYLKWLTEGGHLRSQGEAKPLLKTASHIAKAQANLNLKWTLGNGVDMIRVASHYITRPGGIRNTVKGLYDAAAATQMNPFRRIKALDQKGIYGSQYVDRGGSNKFNPFEWSITAQKNIVYHLDKAAGGDGLRGIRDTLFDAKPWDRPRYDRFEGSGLVAGLARYGINETRWLYKTAKAAPTNPREAANLGLYFLGRAAFTGTTSLVPSFVWQALPQEMKDSIEEFEKSTGQNLIKIGTRSAFQALGMNAEIDLTEYLQPQLPGLGARAQSLYDTAGNALKSGAKTVVDTAQGKLPAAGLNAAATALALANFGMFSGLMGKISKPAEGAAAALENSALNSTTITKLVNTTAKELEHEFNLDVYKVNVLKAAFGQQVKKTEDPNKLPELPKLPTLPKLQSLN